MIVSRLPSDLRFIFQTTFSYLLAYFAPLNPRFKCTISNATAAGVTPEIRLAC
ncbi:hypothetical protein HMPREF1051_0551, partial [Neisseria sicca VK64]